LYHNATFILLFKLLIYALKSNYSVPLFKKEGLGEILLDKSPFFKGGVNNYPENAIAKTQYRLHCHSLLVAIMIIAVPIDE